MPDSNNSVDSNNGGSSLQTYMGWKNPVNPQV